MTIASNSTAPTHAEMHTNPKFPPNNEADKSSQLKRISIGDSDNGSACKFSQERIFNAVQAILWRATLLAALASVSFSAPADRLYYTDEHVVTAEIAQPYQPLVVKRLPRRNLRATPLQPTTVFAGNTSVTTMASAVSCGYRTPSAIVVCLDSKAGRLSTEDRVIATEFSRNPVDIRVATPHAKAVMNTVLFDAQTSFFASSIETIRPSICDDACERTIVLERVYK